MSTHGDHDMGHTVAGWTGSVLAVLGFAVAGGALVLGSAAGLWAGGALTALGGLASWLLHLAGRGKPTGPRPPHLRHWRTPDPAGRHGHPDCLGCRLAGRRGGGAVAAAAAAVTARPAPTPSGTAPAAAGAAPRR
ncbi:HGxxPAAW family protein [Streptomyces rubellomurinus]|uniref:HGxxPAAW family protein n=1 Tax=Streptomyces sp. Y1 TaxID=3238634 RepID=A0AB39TFZ1_9ACTN|nr:HGxxPAAW family protein [Streptomyces rubellomurinus]